MLENRDKKRETINLKGYTQPKVLKSVRNLIMSLNNDKFDVSLQL